MNDGVHFQSRLPLAWQTESKQSPFEAARFLDVLGAIEHVGDDTPDPRDAKLDLQLVWLARLLTPALPPSVEARIGIEHAVWFQAQPLPSGARGWVGFSPSDTLPFLLSLPAQIIACEPSGSGGHRVAARWIIEDQMLREALERMVFRHHREQIRRKREAGL
ncbi:PilZ domain-containing protein [Chitiniphilus eburneus]|nr:PilZ domain-containing protein [Chitiniphilus eburneus]